MVIFPSFAELQTFYPPSLAEGVRGWVSRHCERGYSTRGTSPQLQSSDLARKREWVQLRKQNLYDNANNIDCHDSSLFDKSLESRNDGNLYWLKIAQKHAMTEIPISFAELSKFYSPPL
ncbi:hypothetical protein [Helicobacter sp. T3_23-1059]